MKPQSTIQSLAKFLCSWTSSLFPPQEHGEMLKSFNLLTSMAFGTGGQKKLLRSNLCSDGTPLELSLALDDFGRFAVRFVCDVNYGIVPYPSLNESFRAFADSVVPSHNGRSEMLDHLFKAHLAAAKEEARFRVWYGAGFSPERPSIGKLYFNTEWLTLSEILNVASDLVTPGDIKTLANLSILTTWPVVGVAYDFDSEGLKKVKLYVRPHQLRLDSLLDVVRSVCPERIGAFCQILTSVCGPPEGPIMRGNPVLSVGILPRSNAKEIKLYLQLADLELSSFQALAPLIQRTASGWGYSINFPDAAVGPQGCSPTVFALGVDDEREMLSMYFKPDL